MGGHRFLLCDARNDAKEVKYKYDAGGYYNTRILFLY